MTPRGGPARRRRRRRHVHEGGRGPGAPRRAAGPRGRPHEPPRARGVVEGVARALRELLGALGPARDAVELVAFSTTTAMNALLEGDVARVGVVGIGAQPDLRRARRRTRVGELGLAPGRVLHTDHAFLDATGGLGDDAIDAVLDGLRRQGCTAIAASGAYSVDAPEHEDRVVGARAGARARGLRRPRADRRLRPRGPHGLRRGQRVDPAVVERTAGVVERVLREAEVDVPLLVLRGDGGAMALDAFRRAPRRRLGSGPAAGVAAALQELALADGLVVECGGTSANVTVVKGGRTVLRDLRVMGRPTAIRSVDSWVVGAAGGSMARLGRRRGRRGRPPQRPRRRPALRLLRRAGELDGAEGRRCRAACRRPRGVRRRPRARRADVGPDRHVRGPRPRRGRRRRRRAPGAARRPRRLRRRRRAAAAHRRRGGARGARRRRAKVADAAAEAARAHELGPECRSSRSAARAPSWPARSPGAWAARSCDRPTPRCSPRSARRSRSCARRRSATPPGRATAPGSRRTRRAPASRPARRP